MHYVNRYAAYFKISRGKGEMTGEKMSEKAP